MKENSNHLDEIIGTSVAGLTSKWSSNLSCNFKLYVIGKVLATYTVVRIQEEVAGVNVI